jgi:hypothetical protein
LRAIFYDLEDRDFASWRNSWNILDNSIYLLLKICTTVGATIKFRTKRDKNSG